MTPRRRRPSTFDLRHSRHCSPRRSWPLFERCCAVQAITADQLAIPLGLHTGCIWQMVRRLTARSIAVFGRRVLESVTHVDALTLPVTSAPCGKAPQGRASHLWCRAANAGHTPPTNEISNPTATDSTTAPSTPRSCGRKTTSTSPGPVTGAGSQIADLVVSTTTRLTATSQHGEGGDPGSAAVPALKRTSKNGRLNISVLSVRGEMVRSWQRWRDHY